MILGDQCFALLCFALLRDVMMAAHNALVGLVWHGMAWHFQIVSLFFQSQSQSQEEEFSFLPFPFSP